MTAELQAAGVILSSDPLTTLTADLVNHEVVLTLKTPIGDGFYAPVHSLRIGGQKLLDLIRFAQLAVEKPSQCWRCERPMITSSLYCSVCHMQDHCPDCSEWLHL